VTTPSGSIITWIVLPEIIPWWVTTSWISTTVPGTSLPWTITPEITITSIECNQCPCQYTDFVQNLTNGDEVKAILRNKEKTTLYNYSLPRIVNF
jgi:hypothetical protein